MPEQNGTLTASSALTVQGLEKAYVGEKRKKNDPVVHDLGFEVREGEFYTLLGPSGCGKTTTLRCVAGLEKPDAGRIQVAGITVAAGKVFVPPHRRDIGMVFQSYAIWPHLSVFANVAFPMTVARKRISKTEIKRRVDEVLATVALDGLESRMATQLSGGQQQRLALARALVRRPKLLLLDEPLSNLDAKLRERLRTEVRNLQRSIGVTALYVTHDQTEALSMSSRIAVLSAGRIVQEGKPRTIYQNPASSFVADFVGNTNFLTGTVINDGEILTALGPRPVLARCPAGVRAGDEVTLSIRRENIEVSLEVAAGTPPTRPNAFHGTVTETVFVGDIQEVWIQVGGTRLATRVHPRLRVVKGQDVELLLPPESCVVLSDEFGITSTAGASEDSVAT